MDNQILTDKDRAQYIAAFNAYHEKMELRNKNK